MILLWPLQKSPFAFWKCNCVTRSPHTFNYQSKNYTAKLRTANVPFLMSYSVQVSKLVENYRIKFKKKKIKSDINLHHTWVFVYQLSVFIQLSSWHWRIRKCYADKRCSCWMELRSTFSLCTSGHGHTHAWTVINYRRLFILFQKIIYLLSVVKKKNTLLKK